uniref:Glypican 2 n=1 Tax=Cyprinus carpio TaxID=7962 RepID=A0A8C1R7E2_CYPCA
MSSSSSALFNSVCAISQASPTKQDKETKTPSVTEMEKKPWETPGSQTVYTVVLLILNNNKSIGIKVYSQGRAMIKMKFFRELMDVAEKSMNQMFTQTYGHLYTQNAPIFQQLFSDLRRYYTGGRVSVAEVLSDFWAGLVERVFALVNPQYQFSEDYLECVSKHAEQLRPFGDVPHKLHIQVSRALTAARTLVQSLAAGRDIVNKATKVRSECVRALMRQWFCPLCRGLPFLKPCHSLCLNVMKGCLANQADLDSEWNNFIDALMAVVEKLSGPFHFELAADSIAVKVSEGIMYMQENSISISAKVFQGCGIPRPTPARNKRSSRERDGKRAFRTYSAEDKPTTASGTNLDRLVRSIVKPNPTTGKIFTFTCVCVFCRYLPPVTADGLVNQINNPEMEVDVARPDVKTRQLIMELRVAVNRLKHALNGRDADLIDSECLRAFISIGNFCISNFSYCETDNTHLGFAYLNF